MHSELHDRLEYLVNYSSQLIFVSSDSVAQQQKTLEAFVFKQPNETDIAFITASQQMEIADYRCQLCRQLLGQTVGGYVRPLSELLAALNNHDGPILITITQAQHMPDLLLQELWDLVLQSRFAANRQHLNVLLFGESTWAERAKQWLPAKNTTTPLLISSQSVVPSSKELTVDKLISKRRQEFEKHLAARSSSGMVTQTTRRNPALFWSLIVGVFLLIFGALVAWLYGNKITALFRPLDTPSEIAQTEPVEVGTAYETLVDNQSQDSTTKVAETVDVVSIDERPSNDASSAADASALVADWPEALAQTSNSNDNSLPTDNLAQSELSERQQPRFEKSAAENTSTTTPAKETTEIVAEPAPTVEQVSVEDIQSDNFYIQLAGLKDGQLLEQFVKDHDLEAVVKMYQTQRYGGDWYVLLFHQPFASLDTARSAVANLPQYPGREKAFVKSGSQIKAELNQ
ncbi:SPOR domain-containing protein [Alteromonas ponticola]|uniref:Cell division protein DamX n=1 Tax=Alteromonas ponticola TaxID=2720613 RepID=A0ABX1R499_9ALTE|nr:cell division protein DamX [Alteromonas ponticola]